MTFPFLTLVAVAWTAYAINVVLRARARMLEAREERRELEEAGENGLLRLAANANVRRAKIAMIVAICAAIAGIPTIFFEPNPYTRAISTGAILAFLIGFGILVDRDAGDIHEMKRYKRPETTRSRRTDA